MRLSIGPYVLSNVLSAVAGLLTLPLLARLLTPTAFGIYAIVMTVVAFGQILGFVWLQTSLLRLHSAANDEAAAATLIPAVRLGFVLAAAITSLGWMIGVAVSARSADIVVAARWGLVVLLLRAWVGMAQAHNRATGRHWRYVMTEAAMSAGGAVLAVVAVLVWRGEPTASAPLVGIGAGGLLAALVSPTLLRRASHPRPISSQTWSIVREMLSYGGPLALAGIAAIALAGSDRLLIARINGPAAVGVYSVGYVLADRSITLVLSSIALATKPIVLREYESRGVEAVRRLLSRVAAVLMGVAFPTVTILVCAPETIARVIAGERMASGVAPILPWVAVAALLSGLTTMHFALAFQLSKRSWMMLVALLPAAMVNIGANLLLLPRFGVIAAAWTTLLAYAIALALAWALGRSILRVPLPAREIVRTIVACLPLGAFVRLDFPRTSVGVLVMSVGGLVVYAISAFVFDVANVRGEWHARRRWRSAWSAEGDREPDAMVDLR
ncbi:MAG: lipopolysaccharide biosynthesis protein [bacterium]